MAEAPVVYLYFRDPNGTKMRAHLTNSFTGVLSLQVWLDGDEEYDAGWADMPPADEIYKEDLEYRELMWNKLCRRVLQIARPTMEAWQSNPSAFLDLNQFGSPCRSEDLDAVQISIR